MRSTELIERPGGITRRDFVATGLATGFALAVQPICAQTVIHTSESGLAAGMTKLATRNGEIPAYSAKPEGKGSLPVVLVVQEIFGLHEYIKDVARRVAREGYLAVAPDLYFRQGDVSKLASYDEIRPVVASVPDAQVLSDLDAALEWAGRNGGDPARAGITGFCWGGRIAWLYAAHNAALKAAVAWYGRLETAPTTLQPRNPIDVVAQLHAPVLGLYGGADTGIPEESIDRMRKALAAAGKEAQIREYPGAPHAFHADYRPSYRPEAAEDGWQRMLAWFRAHGVA
jgi:carboxymethylenebutenolidase